MEKLEVHYIINFDNLYFAYLKRPRSEYYDWDENKYTKEEFQDKYKDYIQVRIKDE